MFILNLYKKTDAGNVWCWIRINGSGVTYANVPAESEYYSESSGSTVVHLDPGDKVDVGDCTNPSNIDNLTTFIGFLLQADFSG